LLSACAPGAIAPGAFSSPSWIAGGAANQTLLYVSDGGANAVNVYAYPAGTKVRALTGLSDPTGVCADPTGAVWIVESRISEIIKFAHGGTKRIAMLKTMGAQRLIDCAVDPVTGDLAVTDLGGAAGKGAVWVFKDARGTPKEHQLPQILEAFFCGYDGSGDLFFDGLNKSYGFELAEHVARSSKFQIVNLNQTIGFPGGVRWDGQHLAIGDQAYQNTHTSAIYQFDVVGSTGSVKGTTVLDTSCDVLGFTVNSGTVVAPDGCRNNVKFYDYPAGGTPTKTLSGFQYPVAAAVSIAR